MANLTSSGVTLIRGWDEVGPAGKDRRAILCEIVISSMGTATNNLPASAFGLSIIEEASPFVQDDDTDIVVAAPSHDGTLLLLKASATSAPADLTGTYVGTVRGY